MIQNAVRNINPKDISILRRIYQNVRSQWLTLFIGNDLAEHPVPPRDTQRQSPLLICTDQITTPRLPTASRLNQRQTKALSPVSDPTTERSGGPTVNSLYSVFFQSGIVTK